MIERPSRVSDADLALLRAIGRSRSVVAASRELGISRDRAVYRIARLARAFGGPVVESVRGGSGHGGSVLSPLGDRVLRGGFEVVELLGARPLAEGPHPNLLRGTYRAGPPPSVAISPSVRLRVAFDAPDGAAVELLLDPEAIMVARRRFASSARNVIEGSIVRIDRSAGPWHVTLEVRIAGATLRVTLTEEPVRQLRLRRGSRVVLYVKATALRRVVRRDPMAA